MSFDNVLYLIFDTKLYFLTLNYIYGKYLFSYVDIFYKLLINSIVNYISYDCELYLQKYVDIFFNM